MRFRQLREADHGPVVAVVDGWWGGRQVAGKLPRLFFQYFAGTSFVVEEDGEIVSFLVGIVGRHLDKVDAGSVGVQPGRGAWDGGSTGCSSTRPAAAGAGPCGPSPRR